MPSTVGSSISSSTPSSSKVLTVARTASTPPLTSAALARAVSGPAGRAAVVVDVGTAEVLVAQRKVREGHGVRRALASRVLPGRPCAVEGRADDRRRRRRIPGPALATRPNDACAMPPNCRGTSRVPLGTAGFSQPGGISPRQTLRQVSMSRSSRWPVPREPRPSPTKSSGRPPSPRPRVRRPPESASMPATSSAGGTGGHTGPSGRVPTRAMSFVAPAAAARATVSMTPG